LLIFDTEDMNILTCAVFVYNKEVEIQLADQLEKTSSVELLHIVKNNMELVEKMHQKPTDILFISDMYCRMLQNINQPPFVIVIEEQGLSPEQNKRNPYFDLLSVPIQEQNLCDVFGKVFKIANAYRYQIPNNPSVAEDQSKYQTNETHVSDEQMFIKNGKVSYKIVFDEVLFIKNVGNSLQITMETGKPLFYRSTLRKFFLLLPANRFARVNKSVVVNYTKISRFQNQEIWIHNEHFSVSRIYIVRLRELLRLKRS